MLADLKAERRSAGLVAAEQSTAERTCFTQRVWALAAAGVGLLAFLIFSALALARHQAYVSGRHDLEIYLQTTWNIAHGLPYATTLLKSNELHLAEHISLALLPLAPLYGLIPDPRFMLLGQQVALVLAGLPVWIAARRLVGDASALLLLTSFYFAPALAGVALDDFHAVVLTAAPLAATAYLLLTGRLRAAVILALACLLLEEEAALVVGGLGLWQLAERRWRLGGLLLSAGVAYMLLATLLVMPGFHHSETRSTASGNRSLSHFSELRASPGPTLQRLLAERGSEALLALLLPTGGWPLLAPAVFIAELPTLAALLLQDRADTIQRHWIAPVLPLLAIATAVGLSRSHGALRRAGLAAIALGTASAYLLVSPLPGGRGFDPTFLSRGPHMDDLDRAVAAVPYTASVAASANVAAHLANRPGIYIFPIDDHYLSGLRFENRPIDAYLLDLEEPWTQRVPPLRRSSPLLADPPFVAWSSGHKVILLTREAPTPEQPVDATFNRRMKLLGYDFQRRGDQVVLSLHWQKVRDIFADFDRQVELLAGDGRVVARDRSLPLTSILTTEKWRVGQIVVDRLELPVSGGGPFTLRVGWFNRDRQTPMPLDGGGEALELRPPGDAR